MAPHSQDYMVLLPEAFYEATLLQERVRHPCLRGGNMAGPCRQLRYPALPDTAVPVAAAQGADGQGAPVQILDDADVLEVRELGSGRGLKSFLVDISNSCALSENRVAALQMTLTM